MSAILCNGRYAGELSRAWDTRYPETSFFIARLIADSFLDADLRKRLASHGVRAVITPERYECLPNPYGGSHGRIHPITAHVYAATGLKAGIDVRRTSPKQLAGIACNRPTGHRFVGDLSDAENKH